MNTETLLKILAIIIVSSWAFAGAIRLLYPGIWKWLVEKISNIFLFLTSPCYGLFLYFWPRLSFDSNSLKQHYILPIKVNNNGERETFSSKSFTENDKKRKSEGSLKFERRKTQHNISLESINTDIQINIDNNNNNNQNILPPTPSTLSQQEGRNRSQSRAKKEGRRRGPGWTPGVAGAGRNPLAGRGNKTRGRYQRSINGFDYEFEQPNYDFPPDTVVPQRIRGPSEFDILNPLQPSTSIASTITSSSSMNGGDGDGTNLLDVESLEKGTGNLRYTRSLSANSITNNTNPRVTIPRTTSYSKGNISTERNSDTSPIKRNENQLLDF